MCETNQGSIILFKQEADIFEHSESISEHQHLILNQESENNNTQDISVDISYFQISPITDTFGNNSVTDCCAFQSIFMSDIGVQKIETYFFRPSIAYTECTNIKIDLPKIKFESAESQISRFQVQDMISIVEESNFTIKDRCDECGAPIQLLHDDENVDSLPPVCCSVSGRSFCNDCSGGTFTICLPKHQNSS